MITKTCSASGKQFTITDEDLEFYDRMSPIYDGQKFSIPTPTLCPEMRQQRRLAQSNEQNFYQGKCNLCNKNTITCFPPSRNQPIHCRECWYGDKWDPRDYGRDFDFSRPFFEQFDELRQSVPAVHLNKSGTIENCPYIHYAGHSKNCHLISHADFCEDCYYGYGFKKNLGCVDGFYNLHCELCYDCVYVHKSYGLIGCQDCVNCSNSTFCKDCIGCKNCFLCVGQRQKQYCFMNKQLTRAEYEAKMKKIDLGSHEQYQEYKEKLHTAVKHFPVKYCQGVQNENCTGNYLQHCKNAQNCFDCEDLEDCKNCYQIVLGSKHLHDCYQYGTKAQWCYECSTMGDQSYNILFGHQIFVNSTNLIYCSFLHTCKDCFGCANMNHHHHCILNKQYSEEEYPKMVARIITHMQETGEWGEFFPIPTSQFSYHKTSAQLYFPLEKEEALGKGYHWHEDPQQSQYTGPKYELKDNINDIGEEVLEAVLTCEITGKHYRLVKPEYQFYKKIGLPIPKICPDERHRQRFLLRNPRTLVDRKCQNCECDIRTTYTENRPEKVLCEDCYQHAIN